MGYKSTGGSLHQQVYSSLQEKNGFGRSKHDDKSLGITNDFIYSYDTMKTYMKACNSFVGWVKSQQYIKDDLGHRARTLDECKAYVADWIKDQVERGLSPYTIKMRASALEKLYGEKLELQTPPIERDKITRSRGDAVRDAHFSTTRNVDLITVCRCVGFRRHEVEHCKPEDLRVKDGSYFVEIKGKGGKVRLAPVVGSPSEVSAAVEWIQGSTGHNHVPGAMDVHSYRAEYACRVYQSHAQPISSLQGQRIDYTSLTGKTARDGSHITKNAVYVCRNDKQGIIYDRQALIKASQALGHNRESVVASHYLYNL